MKLEERNTAASPATSPTHGWVAASQTAARRWLGVLRAGRREGDIATRPGNRGRAGWGASGGSPHIIPQVAQRTESVAVSHQAFSGGGKPWPQPLALAAAPKASDSGSKPSLE
ncbi:MAG: hypothetical protein ACK53L_21330, partial [Pirellulaceae bacterium]